MEKEPSGETGDTQLASGDTKPVTLSRWFPLVDPKNPLIQIMAGIWDHVVQVVLGSAILVAILNLIATIYAHGLNSITSAKYWFIAQAAIHHSFITVCLLIAILGFLLLCWRASIAVAWDKELDKYRPRYIIQRVKNLKPDTYLSPYLPGVTYRFRPQDTQLRNCLARLQQRNSQGIGGAYVIGIPMAGKTRMAWEAMCATLSDHWFIRWPHGRTEALPAALFKKQRIVIWLDNLHDYANPNDASLIEDIPAMFQGAHVTIIATCWPTNLWKASDAHVVSLLNILTPIHPSDISENEARKLYEEFSQEEPDNAPAADFEERWDKRTPGSLIVGNESMRKRFLGLEENPKRVLWIMQLLNQAGFGISLREERVQQACISLFLWPETVIEQTEWRRAIGILCDQGFLFEEAYRDFKLIRPAADSYLNPSLCIIPPPDWGMNWASAWQKLPQTYDNSMDYESLTLLGVALLRVAALKSEEDSTNVLVAAETCFRTTLEKYHEDLSETLEATVHADLGLTLLRHSEILAAIDNTQTAFELAAQAEKETLEAWNLFTSLANEASSHNSRQWAAERDLAKSYRDAALALKLDLKTKLNLSWPGV